METIRKKKELNNLMLKRTKVFERCPPPNAFEPYRRKQPKVSARPERTDEKSSGKTGRKTKKGKETTRKTASQKNVIRQQAPATTCVGVANKGLKGRCPRRAFVSRREVLRRREGRLPPQQDPEKGADRKLLATE